MNCQSQSQQKPDLQLDKSILKLDLKTCPVISSSHSSSSSTYNCLAHLQNTQTRGRATDEGCDSKFRQAPNEQSSI